MRLALFGGTFDPPHCGHLAIARAAAARFQLDTVLFTPVGRQPLKPEGSSSSYADRLAMVGLACASASSAAAPATRFAVSDLDAPRPDGSPNYTSLTLEQLAALYPQAALFSLIGADSFRTFMHWHNPGRLLALAEWVVISRPGFPLEPPEGLRLTPADQARIHLLNDVHEDVSSTALRALLRTGGSCTGLLPPSVAGYIARHGLYRA